MSPVGVSSPILTEVIGGLGVITLHRPQALNALSLEMVRELTVVLRGWAQDRAVHGVLLRGSAREPGAGKHPVTHFCAGGDIRFMLEAARAGNPEVEDFFTEEYALDHLIHTHPKPTIAWMEGVTMGGGMGLAQGCRLRVATETLRMAMPETRIGLFPDVGGGYFLSRCAGALGEYLGVVGPHLHVTDALSVGLADVHARAASLSDLLQGLRGTPAASGDALMARVQAHVGAHGLDQLPAATVTAHLEAIDRHFSLHTLADIQASLQADDSDWARATLSHMAGNSPLMMAVTLAQVRRARSMPLADVFRMERTLVRNAFKPRGTGGQARCAEVLEGVQALVVDKGRAALWHPARIAEVDAAEVEGFFHQVWPPAAHPLRDL
ncbi:enoyl-CoA hydratase/isomerase family protein [uncultured Aquabacterium sp.]|uniref:enoyl-CoA hydratase/isomerase family protein n=1 Tax=Aquabacterium commune TaxID=70586 RepID=UPI0030CA6086